MVVSLICIFDLYDFGGFEEMAVNELMFELTSVGHFITNNDLFTPKYLSVSGWNELLIAGFSHRSIAVKDGILLATGLHVHRSSAHQAGVGTIFDRVLTELVAKMREMKMDKTELGCLRAIVLFNPGELCNIHFSFL